MVPLLYMIDTALGDSPDTLPRKRLEVIKGVIVIQDMEALKFLAGFVRGYASHNLLLFREIYILSIIPVRSIHTANISKMKGVTIAAR